MVIEGRELTNVKANADRILVVDDVLAVRRMLERVLREAGYVVTDAADGVEAYRLIEAEA